MKQKVCIIGGGLCGALSAIKCSEMGLEVHLFEKASKILNSFSSVTLAGYNINPGFYCTEYPRAAKLVHLFQEITSSRGSLQKQERYLFFKNSLIKESSPTSRWPDFVSKHIPHANKTYNTIDECESDLSGDLIELMKNQSPKFTPWDLKRHFVIPWFLPYSIDIVSNDEGVKYRNLVRSGKIIDYFYQPIGELYSTLASEFEVYLKQIGVHLHLNCNLDLKQPILSLQTFLSTDLISKLIFAAPCQSLLSYSKPSLLAELSAGEFTRVVCIGEVFNSPIPVEMTQTLFLSAIAPNLTRISNAPQSMHDNASSRKYLCEFHVQGNWNLSSNILASQLKELFQCMGAKVIISEFISLGPGFSASSDWYSSARCSVLQWIKINNLPYCIDPYFGPINMAKAWLMSDKLVQNSHPCEV